MGGTPKYCSLKTKLDNGSTANEVFQLDFDELESSITERTRVLVLNTPHNPTGKMFSMEELERISSIVRKHPNLLVFSDEVYEHIELSPSTSPHISIATLPGMWERTLTMSSAGKTFSVTGWKCGWGVGPKDLIKKMCDLQQWVNFSTPTITQDATARCLIAARKPYKGHDSFYDWLKDDYRKRRDYLESVLRSVNIPPISPTGGFFICADTSKLKFPDSVYAEESLSSPKPMPRDWALARYMTHTNPKVAVIPPSPFYSPSNVANAKDYVRFCFCKTDELLEEAKGRLEKISEDGNL